MAGQTQEAETGTQAAVAGAVSEAAEAPASSDASGAGGTAGTAVGDILPDFETDLLGGGQFHLADYRGQPVIINLWATTCAPCIEELPYYEQLKEAHPDVEILAIHHRAGAKKADGFLADKGWDHLDFALDSKEKGLFDLLEAADAMPQTIVLNTKGEVIYKLYSVSKEAKGKVAVSSKGKITLKKGLAKGTHTIKVKVKALGTSNYKPKTLCVTFKAKVK
jgi:thiol-disulfide isomerase/thioredoxin